MSETEYSPSLYEYGLDADYGARVHLLHERLFKRIRWIITVAQLASVSAVLGPYLSGSEHPVIAAVGGALLVSITIIDAASDFAGRVYEHRTMRRLYEQLSGKIPDMSLVAAKAALNDLAAANDAMCFEGLKEPAFNDNLRRHGREDYVRTLTRWERFMAAIA